MDSYASITGDLALYDKRGKICQWIQDIDNIESIHSRSPTLVTEEFGQTSNENGRASADLKGGNGEPVMQVKLTAPESVLESDDLDFEDDFFAEAAQQALEKGKASFVESDFKSASAYLKEGLTMSKELARKPQALYDTWELRRMLGMCAFHVDSPLEAEDALLSVLANAPKNAILSESQRLQVSETAHLLAQVDVKLGKLDQAYRYCEYALRGRRRVLGKNHEQSYESLALMAKVLELQKNSIRAEFFVGMIPEEEREKFNKKYADLKVAENLPIRQPEQMRGPSTPPPTGPLPKIPDGVRAPPIPRRSPSRSGADVPRSVPEIPRSAPDIPMRFESLKQEDTRPVSALSGRASAMSGPVSAPPSEVGEAISLSPPNSPDMVRLPPAVQQSPMKPIGGAYLDHSPAASQHLLSGHLPPTPPERPDHSRSLSGRSMNTLPVISEPAIPEGQQLTNATGSQQVPGQPGTGPQPQRTTELYPRPLRTQPRAFLSELPGDSEFSNPNTPRSEGSNLTDNTLKHHQTRDSAFTVSSLRRSPNIALPEQEEGSFGQLPSQQPQQPTTMYPYPSPEIAPDHDLRIQDHAYPPSASQNNYTYSQRQVPFDGQSFTSSTYSDSVTNQNFRSATEVKMVPVTHSRTDPVEQKSKRKTSLLRVFRSQSTATPGPSASASNSAPTSDPRNTSLTYNGVRLTRKDIESIKSSDQALTDAAIDFWQEYLEHEMLQHSPRYVLLRPMRSHLLLTATTPVEMKAALPQDIQLTQHVLIPLKSPTRGHWSLLLVSIHDEVACHYDPWGSKLNNRNLASQTATKIANHMGKNLGFVDVNDTPEQVKEQDSGVFVCYFMQHMIGKLQATPTSQKIDASMKCKTIEAKAARKVILKAVEARRKSKDAGTLFEE